MLKANSATLLEVQYFNKNLIKTIDYYIVQQNIQNDVTSRI